MKNISAVSLDSFSKLSTSFVHCFRFVRLTLFFIIAVSIQTHAQWSTNSVTNNPVSTATSAQRFPQSIYDGSGGVIMVWEDYRSGTADIYAQRFNSSGVAQWTSNGVAISTATGEQSSPMIEYDNNGGAIIVWQDLRGGLSFDIYAQRINSSGVVQWTANGVAISTATNHQQKPAITFAGSGGATIAWEDYRSGGSTDYDIYVQRINASGAVQWTSDGVVVCASIGLQGLPDIVGIGSGSETIITWQDHRSGAPDIYGQKINSNGVVLWTANGVAICSAANGQFSPTIVTDGNSGIGGGIISWEDNRSGNSDIYAQRVNGSGVAQWTSDGVAISTATGNQTKAKLVPTGSSEAIITWEDSRSGTADIYGQRINSTGLVQWTANGVVVCASTGAQTNPRIISSSVVSDLSSDGAIITWEDQRSGTYDIYAQQINSSGVVQWTNNGVAISIAPSEQSSPSIVFDSSDGNPFRQGAIVVWDDFRSGNADTYAQRVNLSGVLCGNASTPGAITGSQTILAGSSNTYSVAAVVGATSYTWTLPNGWTGTSTTNSITAIANGTSGSVSVTASNACGTSTGVSAAITVNKQNQSITFNALSTKAMGDPAFDLTATASSGLAIMYVSSNTSVATINGSTVTLVGVGTTTITASQAGNDIFNAATNVLRDLTVNKGNQTISFAALPSKTLGDAPFALTASSSSGLAITYSSSNTSLATISGNTVTLVAVGSVTVYANQAGNANYNAAAQVSQTFCVNPAKPTISASQVNTETPTLTSSSAVGNQWFLNDAAISGATNSTLGVTAAGIYKVQVTVGSCTSAFSETFTFVITGHNSFDALQSEFLIYPNPTFDRLTVVLPEASENKIVTIYTISGQRTDFHETYGKEVQFDVTAYPPGIYLVKISSTRFNDVVRFTKQ